MSRVHHAMRQAHQDGKLTKRQHDVLKLWLNHVGTRRIAAMLELAEPTVREHLRRARENLRPYLESEDS